MHEKGQVFVTDLIFAVTVFLAILVIALVFANQVDIRLIELEKAEDLRVSARVASDALVLTQGSPANWHNLASLDDVNSIGIAKEPNIIDPERLGRLSAVFTSDYYDAKDLIGAAKYDVYIDIEDFDGASVATLGTVPTSSNEVATAVRYARYGSDNVKVTVNVYE